MKAISYKKCMFPINIKNHTYEIKRLFLPY